MKKTAVALASFILLVSSSSALNAQIDQNPPQDIVLDAGNSYEVNKNYSSSASIGNIKSREWNLLDTSQSASGLESQFTFSRSNGVSASNVIRLTVSNGTSTSVDEVTQVVHDVPNASITADKTTIKTGETVSFTSTVTNSFTDGTLTYNWKWDGSGTISGSNSTLQKTFSSTGTYKIKLEVKEAQGYSSTTQPITVQVNNPNNNQNGDTSSGGGGSGGGGGGSAVLPPQNQKDNQTNQEKENRTGNAEKAQKTRKSVVAESRNGVAQVNITKGEGVNEISVRVDPASDEVGVKRISIAAGNGSAQVSVSVRDMGGEKPEKVPKAADQVYSYKEINVSLNDSEIDAAEIDFSVNRTWLEERNRSVEEVVMERYTNGSWNELPTRHVNSTEVVHNFEASSEGFSYYAVALQGAENQTSNETGGETPQAGIDRQLYLVIGAVILVAILGFFWMKRREQSSTEFDTQF